MLSQPERWLALPHLSSDIVTTFQLSKGQFAETIKRLEKMFISLNLYIYIYTNTRNIRPRYLPLLSLCSFCFPHRILINAPLPMLSGLHTPQLVAETLPLRVQNNAANSTQSLVLIKCVKCFPIDIQMKRDSARNLQGRKNCFNCSYPHTIRNTWWGDLQIFIKYNDRTRVMRGENMRKLSSRPLRPKT